MNLFGQNRHYQFQELLVCFQISIPNSLFRCLIPCTILEHFQYVGMQILSYEFRCFSTSMPVVNPEKTLHFTNLKLDIHFIGK